LQKEHSFSVFALSWLKKEKHLITSS
jgi:hypothetical protein